MFRKLLLPKTPCLQPGPRYYSLAADQAQSFEFKTETAKLLGLVTSSLYSDKEVFIRELLSNASDAITRARQVSFKLNRDLGQEPAIRITTDATAKTLTIEDDGIGMSREELIENLGTIAKSGTEAARDGAEGKDLIGKFGVGFYSAFMVSKSISVYSRAMGSSVPFRWQLAGDGKSFTVEPCDIELARGTRIVIELGDGNEQFADHAKIVSLAKNYSAYLAYSITVNGQGVQPVKPLWLQERSKIVEEDYAKCYKELTADNEAPVAHLIFSSDGPISLKSVFFLPAGNPETLGQGRMQAGVRLYSRRVLIDAKAQKLLPDWLRFVSGAIECEELPLGVSREVIQDSALVLRLRQALTKRMVRWFGDISRSEPDTWTTASSRFGMMLREGVCDESTDPALREELLGLLRFRVVGAEGNVTIGLEEYTKGLPGHDAPIVYCEAPSMAAARRLPQVEALHTAKPGYPVVLAVEAVDEFMFNRVKEYSSRPIQRLDSYLASLSVEEQSGPDVSASNDVLEWAREVLGARVSQVTQASSGIKTPGYIADASNGMERLLRLYKRAQEHDSSSDARYDFSSTLSSLPRHFVLNVSHPLVSAAYSRREQIGARLLGQLYDNAMLQAGLIEDPSERYLGSLSSLLESLVRVDKEPIASEA